MTTMITESEFIAAADRTLAAIGEALDAALDGIRRRPRLEPERRHPRDRLRQTAARSSSIATCRIARSGSPRAPAAFISRRGRAAGAIRAPARSLRARSLRCCRAQAGLPLELPALGAPDGMKRFARLRAAPSSRRVSARAAAEPGNSPSTSAQNRARMIELDQVRDLVRDDVQREVGRQLDQAPVEPDHALAGCSFPIRIGRSTA